jgi:hypothetical protein
MPIFGSVQITGFIAPTYSGDTYATHDAYYGRDGLRNVDTESELDSITDLRRRAGMIVGVSGGTKHYRLLPEPWSFTFSDWAVAFLTPNNISQYGVGNRWHVPYGVTVTVPSDFQTFIYGDLYVEGTIDVQTDGQLVVLNGNIIMSGGSIIGSGTTSVIQLPDFDTKVTALSLSGNVLTLVQNDLSTFSVTLPTPSGTSVTETVLNFTASTEGQIFFNSLLPSIPSDVTKTELFINGIKYYYGSPPFDYVITGGTSLVWGGIFDIDTSDELLIKYLSI